MPGRPVLWVCSRCKTFLEPGTGDIMCFIYSYDISEQKLSSEMIGMVVNLDYDYIAMLDCINGEWRICSQNDRNDMPKTPFLTFDYKEDVTRYAREFLVAEDAKRYIEELSISNLKQQLKYKVVYTSYYSICEKNGEVTRKKLQFSYLDQTKERILITRGDVTQMYRKEQEHIRELKKAMMDAQQANAAKTDFLSRMSHDLRTPMNAIIGITALAKDEITDPAAIDDYLDKINSAGTFLLGLVNDCLDIEKIASGKMELHPVPYRYEEFKNSIKTMIEPLCHQKNITFQFGESENGNTVLVDKVRFEQIFFNLLSNAVKFTPEGGKVDFLVNGVVNLGEKLAVKFLVCDNGCGMSEAFQKRMFDPFEQEQNNVSSQSQGTGLGLPIVKSIVDMMGGTIEIRSSLGKGTEIEIQLQLPIVPEQSKQDKELGEKHSSNCLTGVKVLLVEDHPLNMEIAKKVLSKRDMKVTSASNGEEALHIFEASEEGYYQVILMDIRMPVMNGLEATRAIRELKRSDAKTVQIIAMTANAFDEDMDETRDAGMNEHISKPIQVQALYQTLENCMMQSK